MNAAFTASRAAQAARVGAHASIQAPQPDAIQQLPIAIALVAWPFLLIMLGQVINALHEMTEPAEPASIKLNGTAIMMKIQAALDALGEEGEPVCIWLGTDVYYRVLDASMDANWQFQSEFNNEKARLFGIPFAVDNKYGEDAICYWP